LGGTPLRGREAAALVETLARAVQHAHEHGVVHRDLKPANVLLAGGGRSDRGRLAERDAAPLAERAGGGGGTRGTPPPLAGCVPKIADFGLAKRLDVPGQTQTGAVLGTPSYMAPEQAAGESKEIGPAADVYALGAILYELLTGRPPFEGTTLLDTLEQVRSREPRPPISLQPKLPRDLNTICLKCLEKEPRQRYASALELAEDLRRYLDGELIHARAFTIIDRVARTLNREQAVVQFQGFGNLLLWVAPAPLLTHLLGFLLIRNGWPHVTALWMTLSTFVPVLTVFVFVSFRRNLLPSGPSRRDFW